MSTFPWLTVIGAVPLAGALVIGVTPGVSAPGSEADRAARRLLVKRLALVFSLITLGLTIAMMVAFSPHGNEFQFTQTYQWIPQFGVHYAVGVDGIALVLIAMTAVLMPVVILASWNDADPSAAEEAAAAAAGGSVTRPRRSAKTYFALLLVLETMMVGVFAATDVFLFYVFFEAMLIPMYFLIGSFGVGQRQYAAVKFLLYSLFGGLLMLVAVIALYVYSAHGGHPGTFLFTSLTHVTFSPVVQKWLFLGFFIAFAIKAPLWPFHTWLPDAATASQPGTAVLLVGVMDKVGTFGMIRYCLQLFPAASRYFTPLILVLAVIGILYGAIVAIGQRDLKRLIAYTSISHFGFIVLGIFALTTQGQDRRDAVHGQPRVLHRGAVPGRRLHDRPPPVAADRRLRRRATRWPRSWRACSSSPAWPGCPCPGCPPSSASSSSWSARSAGTRWPPRSPPRASSWPRSTSCGCTSAP